MSEYIFSNQEKESEYQRLCLIEDSFDDKSKVHLKKAGLRLDMDVLKVGLGAGSLALYLSEEVGKKGSVLGIDLNTEYALDTNAYDVLKGNVLDLNISKKFDLIHNTSACEILQKLYNLLKPGGILVLEEPDFTLAKWIDAKDIQACKRVNSALCKMFELNGLKAHYGSTAYLSLESLGFEINDSRSYLHLCSGGDNVARLMSLSAKALQESYLQTKICSQEDIQAYIQACQDRESLGVYYATIAITAQKKEIKVTNKEEGICFPPLDKEVKEGIYKARKDEDIFACYDLMKVLRVNLNAEYFVDQIKQQIKEGYELYYLLKNNSICSLVGCKVSQNLAWGKHLYISDFVSNEKERSLGYGKEVLDYLKIYAKTQGCEEIHLDSGVQRFEAHSFYLREGFKIASHHLSYKIDI
ncbi:MAG TPA: GNAT family N-acetyltransferase [Sulfurimonas sp.]|nr:GNAT family N-acetyltransferase [Sulfurimonas sp.]